MKKLVQLRKKNGLQSIRTEKGNLIQPKLFSQKVVNHDEDGEFVGDYTIPTFQRTHQYYTPNINQFNNQWSWGGTIQDLTELIEKCKLKEYLGKERGHAKYGDLIQPGDVQNRLRDLRDPFFTHPTLWTTCRLEGGKFNFDMDLPIHKTLYFIALGDKYRVANRTSDTKNKYIKAGWQFELIESDYQEKVRMDDIDKEVEAIECLAGMKNDEDKMKKIAYIMQLPGYSDKLASASVFILLRDTAAQNNAKAVKFGKDISFRDKFLELANESREQLTHYYNIISGLRKGRIRADGKSNYYMNGNMLPGVKNESQLFAYFANPEHQDEYRDLIAYLEDVSIRT